MLFFSRYIVALPGALLLSLVAAQASAERVLVAVASNFAGPMQEIGEQFEALTGHQLAISTGASGRFFAQIQNGAPFQLFFSADQEKPAALEEAGLAVPGSRFTYAVGTLVLWSANPRMADSERIEGPESLSAGNYRRLALANPRLAPYGQAAVEVLQALDLVESSRSRWVQGENIAQTYQFVSTGNADLGFVALSQLREATLKGADITGGWVVPQSLHGPIRQDAILLKAGADCHGCRELLEFMKTPAAEAVLGKFGYQSGAVSGNPRRRGFSSAAGVPR